MRGGLSDKNQSATPNDPLNVSIKPIIRSGVKKLKDPSNGLIQNT